MLKDDSDSIEILLSSPALLPARGGAELRFLRYLPGLQKRNLVCRILTGTPSFKKGMLDDKNSSWFSTKEGDIFPIEYLDDVPVRKIRLPAENSKARSSVFYGYLMGLCRDSQTRPDLVQMIANLPADCLLFMKTLRVLGVPALYAYTLPPRLSSNPLKKYFKIIKLRRNLNSIDCIIANSSANRDQLTRWGVKRRIEVILNGVDMRTFYPAADEDEKRALRQGLSIPPTAKIFLSVGAVHPRKGTDILLKAWTAIASKIPDAHLYLIGMRHDLNNPKLDGFHRSLESLAAASPASDQIHFLGYVSNVVEYLRASDLLIFPSLIEGMPNAMIEAMACGLPVLTCPFVGLSQDIGRPNIDFLLVDHDPEAIAAAAMRIIDDAGLNRQLRANGHKWIVETLNVERTLDQYAALYHEIASPAKQHRN